MIDFVARVTTSDADRPLVLDTLRRLLGPTRVLSGCACCDVLHDAEDPNRILFVERWEDEESLNRHVKSQRFRAVLAVVDRSVEQPKVRFDWVSRTKGLDYVEEIQRNR